MEGNTCVCRRDCKRSIKPIQQNEWIFIILHSGVHWSVIMTLLGIFSSMMDWVMHRAIDIWILSTLVVGISTWNGSVIPCSSSQLVCALCATIRIIEDIICKKFHYFKCFNLFKSLIYILIYFITYSYIPPHKFIKIILLRAIILWICLQRFLDFYFLIISAFW